jgi:SagB-type dehydrogenase family enzyme
MPAGGVECDEAHIGYVRATGRDGDVTDATGDRIRDYHQRTKHALTGYARGPQGLDWPNQPDPFRTFRGAPRHAFGLRANRLEASFTDLRRPGAVPASPLDEASLGILFEVSLGLAAWKSYEGARWALRCNPSSGNLHPTEGYLLCPDLPGLSGGVYHYAPGEHALELRAEPGAAWSGAFPGGGVLLALSSVHWREAWKYGERAYRYCQHDVGHALAALRYAAAALGWRARLLDDWGDADIAALLGLDREGDFEGAEREHPDLVLWVGPSGQSPDPEAFLAAAASARWEGKASRLSPRRLWWEAIEEAGDAARKPRTSRRREVPKNILPPQRPAPTPLSAVDLFRQRRSAQAYDGATPMSREAFFAILDACLPRGGAPPVDALPWLPRVHFVLFVHRVEGLEPGLYLLARSEEGEEALRERMEAGWAWSPVEGCPPHLRLRLLLAEDFSQASRIASCHQDIAADSAFSLGMLAEFEGALSEGPWAYRQLFWEAGALGQALYMESEAWGFRGTGIGCYFDDEVHRLLGFRDETFQSVYHFTVGTPLEDPRVTTLPPYAHLSR